MHDGVCTRACPYSVVILTELGDVHLFQVRMYVRVLSWKLACRVRPYNSISTNTSCVLYICGFVNHVCTVYVLVCMGAYACKRHFGVWQGNAPFAVLPVGTYCRCQRTTEVCKWMSVNRDFEMKLRVGNLANTH